MNYTALRLLGVSKDAPVCVKSRRTLHRLGGATGIPSWGKFWFSILNVYEWDGNNPIPPELWILPEFLPIHPSKMWCHTRMVYLPMSYLYGIRYRCEENELVRSLRKELYVSSFEDINWPKQANNICEADSYCPTTKLMDTLNCNIVLI